MRYITILFLFISSISFGADRYWVGGHPTNNNWNQTGSGTTNWSATSGGAAGASVPGSSDNVFFDANGNSSSTISASITVLSFTIVSGYTSTITHTGTLTVAGNITLTTGYTVAGSTGITISAASTMTSGGKTWPNGISFSGANTKTLADNWTLTGTLTVSTASTVINATTAETITCGGLTMSGATASGTAKIILSGGTWSGFSALINDLDIAGNVTVSGSVAFNTKTLTYISGTVTTTGSTLTIAASTTFNTAGITWNNINISNTGLTLTINSLLQAALITLNGQSTTFAGTSGFSTATLTCASNAVGSLTLKNGITYTITNAFNCKESRLSSIQTITSDHASNTAALNLSQGATCNVLANFTRITNSGRTIRTFNGTVTSCTGIVAFNDIGTNKH